MNAFRSIRLKAAIVIALVAVPARALADDASNTHESTHASTPILEPMPSSHLWVTSGAAQLHTITGRRFHLPLDSHVFAPEAWERFDTETKRLQEAETRLKAENVSLRETASGWQPGWKTFVATFAMGLAGGWYLHTKITD